MSHLFQIIPTSGVPIYRQIIDQVRRMVVGGHLTPGEELPSVRNLALQLEVNPMTISKAYSLLEAEGILLRRRGRGMQVAPRPRKSRTLEERMEHFEPAVKQFITQAKQLEMPYQTVIDTLQHMWEDS
ncbi:MAG: GntR family transcriptional regulator [Acidobacteriota bacterium]|nr:GntR family transcriptional regulator [Acidobacteriota bacterium]